MQLKFHKRWLLLGLALLLTGCPGDKEDQGVSGVSTLTLDEKRVTLFVAAFRVECINNDDQVQACLAVKESKTDAWEPLLSDIVDFNFLVGFLNIIKVDIFTLDNPVNDDDGLLFQLIEGLFIKEQDLNSTFNFPLRRPEISIVFDEVNGTQALLNSLFFDCVGTLCDTVKSLIDQDMAMVITLQYQGGLDAPDLIAIPCADAKATFDQTCDTTIGP